MTPNYPYLDRNPDVREVQRYNGWRRPPPPVPLPGPPKGPASAPEADYTAWLVLAPFVVAPILIAAEWCLR